MALGDILKVGCKVVEGAAAKAATAIKTGQLVCNDGSGFVPATTALVATNKAYVALDDVKADSENRSFRVLVRGVVVVEKASATVASKGRKLKVDTNGTVAPAAATDVVVAETAEDAAAGTTEITIRM